MPKRKFCVASFRCLAIIIFLAFCLFLFTCIGKKKFRFISLRSESNLHFPIQFSEGADACVLEPFSPRKNGYITIFPPSLSGEGVAI